MDSTALTIPASDIAITVQPCGWSPDEWRAMVAQEIELRAILVDSYHSQMISSKHYCTLQAGQKPALSKEEALNLCSLFKVRVAAQASGEQYRADGHYSVPLDQLDAGWLDKLAQWAPGVKAACENPETLEDVLHRYLHDTRQVFSDLRQMLTAEAAA